MAEDEGKMVEIMVGKDNYLSTAKAIGIVLMVIGHAISQNFAYRFIYMFHMPLFFFCSGYFLYTPSSLNGVGKFLIKKLKSLYWPFIKYGVLFLLLHNFFCKHHLYDSTISTYSFSYFLYRLKLLLLTMTGQEPLLAPFWFLKVLFLSSIILCVMLFCIKKVKYRDKIVILWLIVIFFTMISKSYHLTIAPPLVDDLSIVFLSMSFMLSGYMYKRYEKVNYYSYKGLLVSAFFVFAVVCVYNDYLDMLWYNDRNILIYIPTALVGIFMTLSLSFLIERYPIKNLFYYVGKNTFIIFVFHLLAFKIVNLLKIFIYGLPIDKLADYYVIHEHNDLFWFIYVLFGCILPLVYDYIKKNILQVLEKYGSKKGHNKFR